MKFCGIDPEISRLNFDALKVYPLVKYNENNLVITYFNDNFGDCIKKNQTFVEFLY